MTALENFITARQSSAFGIPAMNRALAVAAGLALATMISGCDRSSPSDGRGLLERLSISGGPDEFAVVPQKPLAAPADFIHLPAPNPGAGNLADLTPRTDFVVAMTGAAPRDAAAAAGDAALVAAILVRAGTAPDDDFDFWGLFGGPVDLLDAQAELERLRALGIRTPAAPPPN